MNRGRIVRTRARALASIALLAIAALTGCVSVPTGGSVGTSEVETEQNNPEVTLAQSPTLDATPEQIIEGFLRAGRGPQNGYAVALEYLTSDFAARWQPTERVLVSSSSIVPTSVDDTGFSVGLSVVAEIDADGHYTTNLPAVAESLTFTLEQDADEQWRISDAPNGTVLSPSRLGSIFDPYTLYYFDPGFTYLVPDVRWFVSNRAVGNRIVNALLGDLPAWLEGGAVVSVFPPGTELTGQVTTVSGRATVPLSAVSSESDSTQQRMLQQLTASLASLGNVRDVTITTGDFPLSVTEGGAQPVINPQVASDPIGALDGAFGVLGDSAVQPLDGIGTAADSVGPTAASLARDRGSVVVRAADGRIILFGADADPVLLDSRPSLVAPSLDAWGFTWTVPANAPSAALAIAPTSAATAIDLGLPAGSTVVSLDVARDGARIMVAANTPTGPRLYVAAIIRAANGVPSSLAPPQVLAVGSATLIDAAWVDGTQVVTLSVLEGTTTAVDSYEIGGLHGFLGTLVGGTAIVGGNTLSGVRVLDSAGAVRRPSGSNWTDTGLRASFLGTQQ